MRTVEASFCNVALWYLQELSLGYVNLRLSAVEQIVGEVINHAPVEIFIHVAESMALCREIEEIEALVGLDECVGHTDGIARMHIVVDIAVYEHQMSLEVAGDLRIGVYGVDECCIALLADGLFHAVMGFAPPAVVDAVVVVAGA